MMSTLLLFRILLVLQLPTPPLTSNDNDFYDSCCALLSKIFEQASCRCRDTTGKCRACRAGCRAENTVARSYPVGDPGSPEGVVATRPLLGGQTNSSCLDIRRRETNYCDYSYQQTTMLILLHLETILLDVKVALICSSSEACSVDRINLPSPLQTREVRLVCSRSMYLSLPLNRNRQPYLWQPKHL